MTRSVTDRSRRPCHQALTGLGDARRNDLTTILGNAQMLRCRVMRAASLIPHERDALLQEIAAIEQAAQALQQGQEEAA